MLAGVGLPDHAPTLGGKQRPADDGVQAGEVEGEILIFDLAVTRHVRLEIPSRNQPLEVSDAPAGPIDRRQCQRIQVDGFPR